MNGPVDVVESIVEIGPHRVELVHPPDAEALIEEEAFEREEFLPYWAELWPSAQALARVVAGSRLRGARVLELGCGLALPAIVAALGGARVLATDWSEDALAFAARNAERNGVVLETARLDWGSPATGPGVFDLVLAADVLYERRNVEQLLALLPGLGPEVLVADPGRPALGAFLTAARETWKVEESPDEELPRGGIYRLTREREKSLRDGT